MRTLDLTGPALDWAVAKCEGYDCQFDDEVTGPWLVPQEGYLHDEKCLSKFNPSTKWSDGGPIIEREKISVGYQLCASPDSVIWCAICRLAPTKTFMEYGPTPLIAAMRCFVASKLGRAVEVPEELR